MRVPDERKAIMHAENNRVFFVCVIFISLIISLFSSPQISHARNKPEIIRHEAHLLGSSINFNVHWQSPNPVTVVSVSVSGVSKTIKVDEYDNKRNPDGYWGELTVNFNLSQVVSFDGRSIMYVVMLEDDLRQKSEQIQGTVAIASKPPPHDTWGTEHLSRPQVQQAPSYQQPTVNLSVPQIGMQGTIQMNPSQSPVPPGAVTLPPTGSPPSVNIPVPQTGQVAIQTDPTKILVPESSNVIIEIVPTGVTFQRMFSITINASNPANQLRWHVINLASGKTIFDPVIITTSQNNLFWTDPVMLSLGSYRVVVQPIFTSGAQSSEITKEFIIDDK